MVNREGLDGQDPDRESRAARAAARVLGGFFAVEDRPGPGWTVWSALTQVPGALSARVAEVRAVLAAGTPDGAVPASVALSLTHLGLVSRLLAPPVGAALATRSLLLCTPAQIHVRLSGANPLPLALSHPQAQPVPTAWDLVEALDTRWLRPLVAPLTAATVASGEVPRGVLESNVLSAVAGALRRVALSRPSLAAAASETQSVLLQRFPSAAGRAGFDGGFRRRSCCLLLRVAGSPVCGDCPVDIG